MIAVAIIALIVLIWGIANRKNLSICNIVESCFVASVISLMISILIGLIVSNIGLHDVSTKQYTVSSYAVKNGYLSYALQKDELDVIKTSSFDIEKSNSNNNYVKKIKQQSKYSYLKWIFIFSDFKTTKTVLCIKTE